MISPEEDLSLKFVHIFFICTAILLCLLLAVWSVAQFFAEGDLTLMVLGIVSALLAVALVIYGIKFLQKLKNLG